MAAVTPHDFRGLLEKAGITAAKPLHAVLIAVHEAAMAAKDTAAGARGLTPEGERELIKRVADQVGFAVDAAIERRLWWVKLGLLLRGAVLASTLLGAGYALAKWETKHATAASTLTSAPQARR